ncbi:MAG: glutathione-disulfide reductase [Alphaproteobacteria bacterium GM202ARS2]|nr:glutathione-disulfide reductase [Alphaproteobacteria bacterium GM202ARS2]
MYDFDFYVIGAGSGGVRAARRIAATGKKVAIAENKAYGGTCVNLGCVPKKLFAYAAAYNTQQKAQAYGWHSQKPSFSWQTLITNKNKEIHRLNAIYEKLLEQHNVTRHDGTARLLDDHHITINNKTYSAQHIIIASGSSCFRPPISEAELAITSDDIFHLPQLPTSIAIIGGGYIAVEFASILHGLGVAVTLLNRSDQLLTLFDHELGKRLAHAFDQQGIRVLFNTEANSIQQHGTSYTLTLKDGTTLSTHKVMFATGRLPNTQGLGLEDVGVATNPKGAILVDDNFRTNKESIYAIGDCIDHVNLTPVAIAQGNYLAQLFTGGKPRPLNKDAIATAVFTSPPLASIGKTQEQLDAQAIEYKTATTEFTPMKYSLNDSTIKARYPCFMKVLYHAKDETVLGLHMLGEDAPEMMQGLAVAFTMGMCYSDMLNTVGIHPTTAEEWTTL